LDKKKLFGKDYRRNSEQTASEGARERGRRTSDEGRGKIGWDVTERP